MACSRRGGARGWPLNAAGAVLDHLFGALGHAEVMALTDVANTASVRVMERLGMTFERRGEHHGLDTLFYRLRSADWTGPRIVVRPATPDDEPLLLSLTPRLADFPRPPWRSALEIDRSDHAVLLEALHRPGPDSLLLVAERPAGLPGGMALVTTQTDYFTHERHPHLETLAISAEMEGRGLARALLDAAEAWARTHGHDFITLTVFDANRRARAVYDRRGYLAETVTMRKPLDAPVGRAVRPAAGPAGLVVRRDTPADADALWDILRAVIAAGETYAYPRDLTRDAALAAWHPAAGHTFVAELDGRLAGTYLLKPNQARARRPRRQLRLHGGVVGARTGAGRSAVPALARHGARPRLSRHAVQFGGQHQSHGDRGVAALRVRDRRHGAAGVRPPERRPGRHPRHAPVPLGGTGASGAPWRLRRGRRRCRHERQLDLVRLALQRIGHLHVGVVAGHRPAGRDPRLAAVVDGAGPAPRRVRRGA